MVRIAALTVIASATPLSEHLAACDTKPMYLWSIPSGQQTFSILIKCIWQLVLIWQLFILTTFLCSMSPTYKAISALLVISLFFSCCLPLSLHLRLSLSLFLIILILSPLIHGKNLSPDYLICSHSLCVWSYCTTSHFYSMHKQIYIIYIKHMKKSKHANSVIFLHHAHQNKNFNRSVTTPWPTKPARSCSLILSKEIAQGKAGIYRLYMRMQYVKILAQKTCEIYTHIQPYSHYTTV